MTLTAFFLRIIRRIGLLNRGSQSIIRRMLVNERSRKRLNRWYNRRSIDEKAIFQNLYSKIFRSGKKKLTDGTWSIRFNGQVVKLPLRYEYSWLDWDNAVSIIGHDPEIKTTYENLLACNSGIRIFFDVGANYGTHSLLFLCNGISTISFEPNPDLKKQFNFFCDLNNVLGNMESFAIGESIGTIDLWYPENASWLGTIVAEKAKALKEQHRLEKITVPLITLDAYTDEKGVIPDLIKIDTEGNEINVLNGAKRLIDVHKPLIIFESNSLKGREALWTLLLKKGYIMYSLPFGAGVDRMLLKESFFRSSSFNFIAVPENYFREHNKKSLSAHPLLNKQ